MLMYSSFILLKIHQLFASFFIYSSHISFPMICVCVCVCIKHLFIWLHQVLVAAHRIFDLHCGRVESSYPTKDQTWTSCIQSVESWPLDHQGSPSLSCFKENPGHTSFYLLIHKICISQRCISFLQKINHKYHYHT